MKKFRSILPFFEIILRFLIYLIFIIILANPWFVNTEIEDAKKWIDIVLIFDISKSMLAEDMKPNRIEVAKKVIWDFISKIKNDRLAFVVFAGKPFTSIPLTFDYEAIKNYINKLTTDSINQEVPWLSWTAIGDALITWANSLFTKKDDTNREKVIILVTDWEANIWIDPKIAWKFIQEKNIKVYSIWIGSKDWTELFITDQFGNKQYFKDNNWVPIKAKVDEELLTNLSLSTKWKYYNASSKEALEKIFEELSKLNKKEVKITTYKSFLPISFYFLFINFLLILILIFIRYKLIFKI